MIEKLNGIITATKRRYRFGQMNRPTSPAAAGGHQHADVDQRAAAA